MTVAQIAEITGRTERCVRNWIYTAATREKDGKFLEKYASDKECHDKHDFSKVEVFKILRAGLGEQIAGVYMANAMNFDNSKDTSLIPQYGTSISKDALTEIVTSVIKNVLPVVFEYVDNKDEYNFKRLKEELDARCSLPANRSGHFLNLLKDADIKDMPCMEYSVNPCLLKPRLSIYRDKEGKLVAMFFTKETSSLTRGDRVQFLFENGIVKVSKYENGFKLTKTGVHGLVTKCRINDNSVFASKIKVNIGERYLSIGELKDEMFEFKLSDMEVIPLRVNKKSET